MSGRTTEDTLGGGAGSPPPVRIVLVNTSHPGNIGGAARAMKNMGLDTLCLVAPRHFPHAEATARASGADDLLQRAMVCERLEDAIGDCGVVFGASARSRSISWPSSSAREAAERVAGLDPGVGAAIVFGNEQSGLSNRELDLCRQLLHIPANPGYSSLNLAMAVQIVAYEMRVAMETGARAEPAREEPLATAGQLEGMYEHLQRVMEDVGFLDPGNPRYLMRRMRRLFNRAELDENELNILRGVLTAVEKTRAGPGHDR